LRASPNRREGSLFHPALFTNPEEIWERCRLRR
jgi:hypothetical protein